MSLQEIRKNALENFRVFLGFEVPAPGNSKSLLKNDIYRAKEYLF